jgi:hypothetical protein
MILVQRPPLRARRAAQLPRLLPLVAAALLSGGCTLEEESPGRSIRTDSAGIAIVTNYSPAWRAEEAWLVVSMPLFQVDPAVVQEAQFQRLLHVQRNSDGTVVAVDEVPPFVRAFTADGEPRWVALRKGGGPAEVREPVLAYGMRGDTTIVEDGMGDGAALVASDGSVAGRLRPLTVRDSTGRNRALIPFLRLVDGGALAYEARFSPADLEGTGFWTPSWNMHLLSRDAGSSILLGPLRVQVIARGRSPVALLSPLAARAATRDGFVYGFPIRDEFSIHGSDGSVSTLVRRPTPSRILTSSEEEQARSRHEKVIAARSSPEIAADLARTVLVFDTLPAYGRMVVSQDGSIWRERYEIERDAYLTSMIAWSDDSVPWDVHSEDGSWLGTVRTPPRFALTSVGKDWIAGIHADENDVQTPRVYRLIRP